MVATDGYPLGHSEAELKRLAAQVRMVDPITRRCCREPSRRGHACRCRLVRKLLAGAPGDAIFKTPQRHRAECWL